YAGSERYASTKEASCSGHYLHLLGFVSDEQPHCLVVLGLRSVKSQDPRLTTSNHDQD
ncbi:hypothetical protein JMJ77_0002257, partial [Colletotrichum scovillei]